MLEQLNLRLGNVAKTPAQVSLFSPADSKSLRDKVYGDVLNAASSLPDVVGTSHTLRLTDVHFAEDDPEFDKKREKEALLSQGSLGRRLRGTWSLIDNTSGQVVDQRKQVIAQIPAILQDGSFIHRGTRYAMGVQQRLRPGIYVRHKKNGEAESFVNAKSRTGRSHRYLLQPETGLFYINIEHSKVPLVPLLEMMGVKRDQIEQAWGKDLTDVNYKKKDPKAVQKIYDRIVSSQLKRDVPGNDELAMKDKIVQAITSIELDPAVTRRTLGREADRLDADLILRATSKTLKMLRDGEDADDRDHPAYASYYTAADIFSERIRNDYDRLRRQLLYKVARKGNLQGMPSGALNRQIDAAIFKSGLAQTLENVNHLETLGNITKVTLYGEGGLPSSTSTPEEARNVNPGQFGFIDSVVTPESIRIGVDGFLASGAMIGSDNNVYTKVIDNKTQEEKYVSPGDVIDGTLSLGASPLPGRELAARNGKLTLIKKGTADYRLPHFENAFSYMANLVPTKSTMFAQRASMASRMSSQAIALQQPEAPLVQTAVPGTNNKVSYEDLIGSKLGAVLANKPGRVIELDNDYMTVKYQGGETERFSLENNLPGARKTVFHQVPLVKVGDEFTEGQAIIRGNQTDQFGVAALGRNMRTALVHLGDNWEDAIGISESAARKLSIDQAYKSSLEPGSGVEVGKKRFVATLGNKYSKEQFDLLDSDGVIQVGATVHRGDPLILALNNRGNKEGRVHRQGKENFADATLTWQHNHSGVVTDVMKTKKGMQVVVRTSKPLEEGDKISGRHGNKGVVRIYPDSEMPTDENGEPIEIAISPLAVISRGNASFPIELALAKVAAKRGEPYRIEDFNNEDIADFVSQELKKYGVKDTETLTDPTTGRKIPNVLVGPMFTMALHHTSESKGSGRGIGGYNAEGLPTKGDGKAKRSSGQELWSLISHGAYALSRENTLLRGQRNDEYWQSFMSGQPIGEPTIPSQYEGFVQRLQSMGVNPVRKGTQTQLMAMTDKDVDQLAGGREVTVADTVDMFKDLSPIKGGLFDERLFGDGDRFAYIQLKEAVPNPVFEEPLRKILGVTEKVYRGLIAGEQELPGYGRGLEGLRNKLKSMDVDEEIKVAREQIAGTKKTARDAAVKRLGYLKALKRTGLQLSDLLINKVPVLPPRFRPIARMKNSNNVMVNDLNFLYKELMLANETLGKLSAVHDDVGAERLSVYDNYKALVGLADPTSRELQQRKVKGLLKTIVGTNPKNSLMQRNLLSGTVDTVGRGVITIDKTLDMDQIGIPEGMAFDVYQPYIVRELVQRGIPRLEALQAAKDRTDLARDALNVAMKQRPVVTSRAPVLHRRGILALEPQLVRGDVIKLNPFVYKGLGADNDGDAMNFHVPHSDRVVREVRDRMKPSRMLINEQDFVSPAAVPSQDFLLGLFQASTKKKEGGRVRRFASLEDANAAWRRGELDIDDLVRIGTT